VINILSELGLPLPPSLTALYQGSSSVNFRFPGGPECYFENFDFVGRFLLILMIPVFFLDSFLAMWGLGVLYFNFINPPDKVARKRRWMILNVRAFLFMLDFCYLIICTTIFRIFFCSPDPVTGAKYLASAPWIECSVRNSTYWTMFVLAVIFFILYIIGIPLLLGTLLYHFRYECSKELGDDNSDVVLFIGWLHCDFKPEFFYWELVMLFRKAIFAMSISLTSFASYMLPVFVFVILVVSLLVHRHFKPFVTPIDNNLEVLSDLVLLFNFYMALIYFIPTFSNDYLEQLGYFTVVVNALFLFFLCVVLLFNMGIIEITFGIYSFIKNKLGQLWDRFFSKREELLELSEIKTQPQAQSQPPPPPPPTGGIELIPQPNQENIHRPCTRYNPLQRAMTAPNLLRASGSLRSTSRTSLLTNQNPTPLS
jgi:hypothetical protein